MAFNLYISAHLLLEIIIFPMVIVSETELRAKGMGTFESVLKNKRVLGLLIIFIRVKDRNTCITGCNRHPQCVSINFCDRGICELLSADVFSTTKGRH